MIKTQLSLIKKNLLDKLSMEQHFRVEETISLLAWDGWKLMLIAATIKPR